MKHLIRVHAVRTHSDDIALGCGGTLAKLPDSGCDIGTLIMTDSLQGLNQSSSTDRNLETREALADQVF